MNPERIEVGDTVDFVLDSIGDSCYLGATVLHRNYGKTTREW
jgi:hypothetical protein